ncbi:MAG: hypothetical protein MJ094_08070 [Saccharofermentans sp.]|nr:hypothetical protein [Saccharofermentans sp.]
MQEVFDSNSYNLRYDEETNSCVLVWKKFGGRDEFRTPLMHLIEMIKKHNCKDLIMDGRNGEGVPEDEWTWARKVAIPGLGETSLKHIYFVVDADSIGSECTEKQYSYFIPRFKLDKVSSVDAALSMIKNGGEIVASPEILAMTKADAIAYLGLPAHANDYAVDDKFWKLTKNLRGDNSPEGRQKIADLSAAYDIATGKRDERVKKEEIRNNELKIFGKTGEEWRTYFSYTWYMYLIGLVLIFVAGNLAYDAFIKPRVDSSVIALGHFSNDSSYMEDFLTIQMGFQNPTFTTIDIVVPNDQGQMQNAYASQSASTLMLSCPNVLIFDKQTASYYYSAVLDMSPIYELCRDSLTPTQFAKLRPVFLSERDAMEIIAEYEETYGAEMNSASEVDLSQFDDTLVMIGIEIDDPEVIDSLGFDSGWPVGDPSLVFSVYYQTMDYHESENIIINLFRQVL